jgi:hypothetical protein
MIYKPGYARPQQPMRWIIRRTFPGYKNIQRFACLFPRPVELEESKRKCDWVRIDFDDFEGQ